MTFSIHRAPAGVTTSTDTGCYPPTRTVWREGSRIRGTDGTGVSDAASDRQVRVLLAETDDPAYRALLNAALAIRAYERVVAG